MNEKMNELFEMNVDMNKKIAVEFTNCLNFLKQNKHIKHFVIIKNENKKYVEKIKNDFCFDVEFDSIFFDDCEQMKNFISKKIAYDYIDNTCKLNENECVVFFV